MPLQALEPRRLYRQIADQLARLMDDGEFRVGQRLPPERALAETLRVSRPSVREALIALEVEGRVEIRGGSGVYVLDPPARPGNGATRHEVGPFELLAARRLVEPEVARLAASNATPDLLDRLEETMDGMDEAGGALSVSLVSDRAFHVALAEGSGNAALAVVVETLWDQRTGPLYLRLESHFHSAEITQRAIAEHRAIIDAIRNRDPEGARSAMLRHIGNAETRFSTRWERS